MIQESNRKHFRLLFRKESLVRNLTMFLIVLRLMKKRKKKTKKRNSKKFRRKKKAKEIFKNSIKLYFLYLLFLRLDLIQVHFTISLENLFGLLKSLKNLVKILSLSCNVFWFSNTIQELWTLDLSIHFQIDLVYDIIDQSVHDQLGKKVSYLTNGNLKVLISSFSNLLD